MAELLAGLQLIEPRRHGGALRWFTRSYSEHDFAVRGIVERFVQDDHPLSCDRWTLRGLPYQVAPHAQAKLVRCVRGRVFDVAVDLRAGPTFGRWCGVELSAENGRQLYIPIGFALGFLTVERVSEIIHKVSSLSHRPSKRGLRCDEPALASEWPLPAGTTPLLSPKDADLPHLGERSATTA